MKKIVEKLQRKLAQKEQGLTSAHQVITPEDNIPAEIQAEWMIALLNAVYTKHGIANNPERVISSIANGDCRCWFMLENGKPVATASLIRQPDGSIEMGRAVALSPGLGLGSIARLRSGLEVLKNEDPTFVSEVRMAGEFLGIPSGRATQKVAFDWFELTPHALAPMFSHGNPIRQEIFALGSTQKKQASEVMALPENRLLNARLSPAVVLGKNLFRFDITERKEERGKNTGFSLVQTEPFSVVVPEKSGGPLELVEKEALEKNSFALLPIEAGPINMGVIHACFDAGWVPCGIDRTLGQNGHPVLLFGKLATGTLLAPIDLLETVFSREEKQALQAIDTEFRRNK